MNDPLIWQSLALLALCILAAGFALFCLFGAVRAGIVVARLAMDAIRRANRTSRA